MVAFSSPTSLQRGDTIGVFAPSSSFPEERYQRGLEVIRGLGYRVKEVDGLREKSGYLAGPDTDRVQRLYALLDDPDVRALWAARGGYGLHRILPMLDGARIRAANKAIVGFSDVCALHAVAQQRELVSIHGPVVTQMGDLGPDAHAVMQDVLEGRFARTYVAGGALGAGLVRGRIVGGCLSVIAPLVGTPYLPDLDGAILLLEDVGEATYRIDRLLTHLRLAGVFERVAGVALGEFVGCKPRDDTEPTIEDVLSERLGDLDRPVLTDLPFGHGKRNLAIPLGKEVELDAAAKTLRVLD